MTIIVDVVDGEANLVQVMADSQAKFPSKLFEKYPSISMGLGGGLAAMVVTGDSIGRGFGIGFIAMFLLLALMLGDFVEPEVVILVIPLALIGVIWEHLVLGHDLGLVSVVGFIALAGIVVNDSIILVVYIKRRVAEGMTLPQAAARTSRDRFRATFLISITTIASVFPLFLETSVQGQIDSVQGHGNVPHWLLRTVCGLSLRPGFM